MKQTFHVKPTNHAEKRANERIRNKKNANIAATAEKAILRGVTYFDARGKRQRYLYNLSRDGCIAVAYDDQIFIISSDETLVTLYGQPDWFRKHPKGRYHGKEKIRNWKSYQKTHRDDIFKDYNWEDYDPNTQIYGYMEEDERSYIPEPEIEPELLEKYLIT